MLLYWQKGRLEFTTDVEDWMADHTFTEVFRYRGSPTTEEMEITNELDRILYKVRFGRRGIDETLKTIARNKSVMVSGKQPGTGEQSRGAAEGNAVDGVFKNSVKHALDGKLLAGRIR